MRNRNGMNTPDLDLDLVRCFLAVAESGSFTLAARRLNLSQSAVSLKIQRLEELLGRKVFARTNRSVVLTAEGDIALGYARRLLELGHEMVRHVAQPAVAGTLRLGVVQQFGHQFLPELLARFKRQHPRVFLTVEVGMTMELLTALEADRFDLVLGAAGSAPRPGGKPDAFTEDRVLMREPLVWVGGGQVTKGFETETLPLVLFTPPCSYRRTATESLEAAGRAWEVVYSSSSLASIQAAVQAGLGVSVLGRSCVLPGMKILGAKAKLPRLPESAIALYRRKSPHEALARSLGTFIADAIAVWQKQRLAALSDRRPPSGTLTRRPLRPATSTGK